MDESGSGLGEGVRLDWSDVPEAVHAWVSGLVGGPVVSAVTCRGGFSPGAASALAFDGGRRAFVKAVSTAQNPDSPRMYRQEAAVNTWLGAHPAIPSLLGTYDDGDWVALAFEHVDAPTPPLPWRRDDLDAVLRTLVSVQDAAGSMAGRAPRVVEAYAEEFGSWARLCEERPTGLDEWSLANLDRLAEVASSWQSYADGDTLVHTDVRADNVLVRDGRAWLVDWAWAATGAGWVDAVLFAPTVALQGGPPPEELVAAAYPAAPREGVLAVAAGLAGFFTRACLAPPPPGLPTVRVHQAAAGRSARAWVARMLDG